MSVTSEADSGGVDWSQFLPDALLTVPAAVGIGFWLWRVQNNAQRKAEEREAIANWTMARTRFSEVVTSYANIDVRTPTHYIRQFAPFVDLSDRFPNLAAWALAAKIEPELQNVRKVLVNLPELRKYTDPLTRALEGAAGRESRQRGEQRLIAEAAFWKLLPHDWDEDSGQAELARSFREQVEAVMADEEVHQAWLGWEMYWTQVQSGFNKLYQSLSMRGPFHYSMEAEEWDAQQQPYGC